MDGLTPLEDIEAEFAAEERKVNRELSIRRLSGNASTGHLTAATDASSSNSAVYCGTTRALGRRIRP